MKILLATLALAVGLVLAGCNSASQLNEVRIGMTKDQVISLLGQPDSTSAEGNVEYLTYYLLSDPNYGREQPYMVRLVDDKVESFGRFAQLWDLYERPVNGSSVEVPQMGAPGVPVPGPAMAPAPAPAPDIVTQLEKLKELKDQGVLTEAEFEQAKAKVLSESQ